MRELGEGVVGESSSLSACCSVVEPPMLGFSRVDLPPAGLTSRHKAYPLANSCLRKYAVREVRNGPWTLRRQCVLRAEAKGPFRNGRVGLLEQ